MGSLDTITSIIDRLPSWAGRPAIISYEKDGMRSWSYDELARDVEATARGFARTSAGRSDYVLILAPPNPEWIIACLAAVRAGAIAVPLDAQIDDATLRDILNDLKPKFVCTTAARADRLNELLVAAGATVVLLDLDSDERSWRRLATGDDVKSISVASEDIAALFYTSGTTGAPKGVPLSNKNILFQVNTLIELGLLSSEDRLLLPLPLHHIYPFVVGMLFPLALGLLIIMPESLTGPKLTRAIHDGAVTTIIGVPRLYSALCGAIEARARSLPAASVLFQILLAISIWSTKFLHIHAGKFLFAALHKQIGPNLRLLACGGASLDTDLAWKLEGLGWPVVIGYGLTETSPLLAARLPGKAGLDGVGSPLPGVQLRIDPQALSRLGDDWQVSSKTALLTGEVLARGPGVFGGYRNLPEKNAEAFTADGWFRTGDFGWFRGNELHVLGRISSLIIGESGENIDPEELEQYYSKNPVIKEIGVLQDKGKLVGVAVPDMTEIDKLNGGDVARLVSDAVDERSVHIASYKRLSGVLVSGAPLQRNAIGKIQRHKLRVRYDFLRKEQSFAALPQYRFCKRLIELCFRAQLLDDSGITFLIATRVLL